MKLLFHRMASRQIVVSGNVRCLRCFLQHLTHQRMCAEGILVRHLHHHIRCTDAAFRTAAIAAQRRRINALCLQNIHDDSLDFPADCRSDQAVYRRGGVSGRIQLMEPVADLPVDGSAGFSSKIQNFISGRIQNDAGMVVVLLHHLLRFFLPAAIEEIREVIPVLLLMPHIGQLIHDKQPVLIAGSKHLRAHGMVRAADGIEAGLLDFTGTLPFCCGKGSSADDSIVMMDAGSSLLHRLSVEAKSALAIQCQHAKTRPDGFFIHHFLCFAQNKLNIIQIRILTIPKLRILNQNVLTKRLGILRENSENHAVFRRLLPGSRQCPDRFQHHFMCFSGEVLHLGFHLGNRRLTNFSRGDTNRILHNVHFISNQKIDIAVNTASGVPAAVGIGIVGDHLDFILFPGAKITVQHRIEAAVAV